MLQIAPSQDPSKVRLFCLPHAGAGPSAFRGWAQALAPEIETTVIQLPGRETRFRETPYLDFFELVRDLAAEIPASLGPHQKFGLFGNSFGALVAFEVARRIGHETGREPAHLFVAATYAPHLPPPLPPMSLLSDPELVREVSERYDGIPAVILQDAEYLAAVLPALRADLLMLDQYARCPPEPLHCPLTAFAGRFDRTIPAEMVEAWGLQTTAVFAFVLLEQPHLFLQYERERLTGYIRRALAETSAGNVVGDAARDSAGRPWQ